MTELPPLNISDFTPLRIELNATTVSSSAIASTASFSSAPTTEKPSTDVATTTAITTITPTPTTATSTATITTEVTTQVVSTSGDSKTDDGMSGGAIAALVVVCVLLLLVLLFVLYRFCCRRRCTRGTRAREMKPFTSTAPRGRRQSRWPKWSHQLSNVFGRGRSNSTTTTTPEGPVGSNSSQQLTDIGTAVEGSDGPYGGDGENGGNTTVPEGHDGAGCPSDDSELQVAVGSEEHAGYYVTSATVNEEYVLETGTLQGEPTYVNEELLDEIADQQKLNADVASESLAAQADSGHAAVHDDIAGDAQRGRADTYVNLPVDSLETDAEKELYLNVSAQNNNESNIASTAGSQPAYSWEQDMNETREVGEQAVNDTYPESQEVGMSHHAKDQDAFVPDEAVGPQQFSLSAPNLSRINSGTYQNVSTWKRKTLNPPSPDEPMYTNLGLDADEGYY